MHLGNSPDILLLCNLDSKIAFRTPRAEQNSEQNTVEENLCLSSAIKIRKSLSEPQEFWAFWALSSYDLQSCVRDALEELNSKVVKDAVSRNIGLKKSTTTAIPLQD